MKRHGDEILKVLGRKRGKQPLKKKIIAQCFQKVIVYFQLCLVTGKSLSNVVQKAEYFPLHCLVY